MSRHTSAKWFMPPSSNGAVPSRPLAPTACTSFSPTPTPSDDARFKLTTASTTSPSGPAQEESPNGDGPPTTAPVMSDDVLVADDPEALTGAIDEVRAEMASQVDKFETAQAALDNAIDALADADTAVSQTELHIEELTALSDEAVVDAFVNPPAEDAIATLASDNAGDATVRAAVLELQADADAEVLAELAAGRERTAHCGLVRRRHRVPRGGPGVVHRHLGRGPVGRTHAPGRRHPGGDGYADGGPRERPGRAPRQQPGRPELVRVRRQRRHVLRHPPVRLRQSRRRVGGRRHGDRLRRRLGQRRRHAASALRVPPRWRRGGQPLPHHQRRLLEAQRIRRSKGHLRV